MAARYRAAIAAERHPFCFIDQFAGWLSSG